MNQKEHLLTVERNLLSHVEVCYEVALALTRDQNDAQDLVQDVLTQAWLFHCRTKVQVTKQGLLTELRERFLQDYHLRSAARFRDDSRYSLGIAVRAADISAS